MLIIDALIFAFCIGMMGREEIQILVEKTEYEYIEYEENPNEAELSRSAIVETIGTDEEEQAFGYDFTQLVGIIYNESGGDYQLSKMIGTCVLNAQKMSGCRMDPIEVCNAYGYAKDKGYYGSRTLQACLEVFLDGDVATEVGNATMFYNPKFTEGTPCHESKTYVCSYYHERYGEIRFFEE